MQIDWRTLFSPHRVKCRDSPGGSIATRPQRPAAPGDTGAATAPPRRDSAPRGTEDATGKTRCPDWVREDGLPVGGNHVSELSPCSAQQRFCR